MANYPSHPHHRNYGCRLREFVLNDFRAISLENEKIRVTILIDKGTDIYEFLFKPKDVDFLWKSRLGLRSMKNYQPMTPGAGGMFLDFYEGGWQELFPWGGHASSYRGVETGLHGEVALEPWSYCVDVDTPEEVRITCSIRTRRAPFLLNKSFAIYGHQASLQINEVVLNESGEELPIVWGHHPAYGWPFLDDSCVIDLPSCKVKTAASLEAGSRLKENFDGSWPLIPLREEAKPISQKFQDRMFAPRIWLSCTASKKAGTRCAAVRSVLGSVLPGMQKCSPGYGIGSSSRAARTTRFGELSM